MEVDRCGRQSEPRAVSEGLRPHLLLPDHGHPSLTPGARIQVSLTLGFSRLACTWASPPPCPRLSPLYGNWQDAVADVPTALDSFTVAETTLDAATWLVMGCV